MIIAYDSKTGNVKRFINKLNTYYEILKINKSLLINDKFVLVTFTTGFGEIPETTKEFLKYNHKNLVAVASSGNKNWGSNYGKAADIISNQYNVPLILKFELSGTKKDIKKFLLEVDNLANNS